MRSLLTTIALTAVCCGQSIAAAAAKPIVAFILADDLGWSDTALYGTTTFYQTPNIQRMAKRGMTKGEQYAKLRPEIRRNLARLGWERALISLPCQ